MKSAVLLPTNGNDSLHIITNKFFLLFVESSTTLLFCHQSNRIKNANEEGRRDEGDGDAREPILIRILLFAIYILKMGGEIYLDLICFPQLKCTIVWQCTMFGSNCVFASTE